MRTELSTYLERAYPASKIETPHSIFGNVHIRFELGGEEMFKIFRDGVELEYWKDRRRMTKVDKINLAQYYRNRVSQATSRATTIFRETFDNLETEIWIIVYEYAEGLFNNITDYWRQQVAPSTLATFYDEREQIETQMISTDENGSNTFDKVEARVTLGKVKLQDIQVEKILDGIANNEIGVDVNVCQDIYFLDPVTNKGFYMYDDRGCYVWGDKAERIKYLFDKRNDWILDYHRLEINNYFVVG